MHMGSGILPYLKEAALKLCNFQAVLFYSIDLNEQNNNHRSFRRYLGFGQYQRLAAPTCKSDKTHIFFNIFFEDLEQIE